MFNINKIMNLNKTEEKHDCIFSENYIEGISVLCTNLTTGSKCWGVIRFKNLSESAEKRFDGRSVKDVNTQIFNYLQTI